MPQPLRKIYPALDLDKAQEFVRHALQRAFQVCGGQNAFARLLNADLERRGLPTISRQAVGWWYSEGTFVDRQFWEPIEAITDFAVTRRQLRPDMYRDDPGVFFASDRNPLLDAIRWLNDVPSTNGNYLNAVRTAGHLTEMLTRVPSGAKL